MFEVAAEATSYLFCISWFKMPPEFCLVLYRILLLLDYSYLIFALTFLLSLVVPMSALPLCHLIGDNFVLWIGGHCKVMHLFLSRYLKVVGNMTPGNLTWAFSFKLISYNVISNLRSIFGHFFIKIGSLHLKVLQNERFFGLFVKISKRGPYFECRDDICRLNNLFHFLMRPALWFTHSALLP